MFFGLFYVVYQLALIHSLALMKSKISQGYFDLLTLIEKYELEMYT